MNNSNGTPNRNFLALTLEGSFFFFGIAFMGENTIVPIFVDTYTGSMELLGLALTLLTIAKLLPKLVLGPYISQTKDMSRLLKVTMLMHRPLPFIMIPVMLLLKNDLAIFWIFLLMYCIFWGINGVAAVAWADVFARTIPGDKRGQLQGNQLFIGGIASLLSGYIIKIILDNDSLSQNNKYLIIFVIGGAVLLVSALVLMPVRDVPRKISNEKIHVLKYFTTLPVLLHKNKRFTAMVIAQSVSRFSDLILPLIIVISKSSLHFTAARLSTLVVFQVAGGMIGGILWGSISRRYGNKSVIVAAEVTGFIISALTLLCITFKPDFITFPIMCIVIALAGAKNGGWVGYSNYMLDVIGEENRIDYLTLNTIILFPLSFTNYVAGIANQKLGFMPMVVFCVVIAALCTYIAIRLRPVSQK